MIFWRILDNKLYSVDEVEKLGFEKSEDLRIPDEYLEKQEFVVMRTCHAIGDWGIISAMPRLLNKKYPNCKVYIPSPALLKKMFGDYEKNWSSWNNPFENVKRIFDDNPYVDGYKDEIDGEVFHDHYRIYDDNNVDVLDLVAVVAHILGDEILEGGSFYAADMNSDGIINIQDIILIINLIL